MSNFNVTFNLLTILELIRRESSNTSLGLIKGKYKEIIIHLFIVIFVNICFWVPSTVVFILPLTGCQMPSIILTMDNCYSCSHEFYLQPNIILTSDSYLQKIAFHCVENIQKSYRLNLI